MADEEGPQAPPMTQGSQGPLVPQNPPPPQNPQIPLVCNAPQVPQALYAPQQPTPHMSLFNWSHFKPKFSRKQYEDAETHLLRTNNLMDTHRFQDNVKVQKLCLTLTGEARLWYKLLRLIIIDWLGLQNSFRQQYSKIADTREHLFHSWRSFNFKENADTINAYVHHIRQVTTLLGYQEPQILQVFKNTLLTKLYWVLFLIMDLRQAVETAKGI